MRLAGRRRFLHGPLLVAALLAVSACRAAGTGWRKQRDSGPLRARVTHVVDGDTIDVELADGSDDTVRYIGIDTPETVKPGTPVQCGGPKAHEVNDQLVYGKTVTLRFDEEHATCTAACSPTSTCRDAGQRPCSSTPSSPAAVLPEP